MSIKVKRVNLEQILDLRALYLQENNFQIRYNACHERGWSDSYIIIHDGVKLGYGSVKGLDELRNRNTIFEYYVLPEYRNRSSQFFEQLIFNSQILFLESQSNDLLMSAMMFEFGKNISSEVVLFEDHTQSRLSKVGFNFRKLKPGDDVFGKKESEKGAYVLEFETEIIADGGFLTHYNPPFADLYMEVKPAYRGQGLASFILQEIKKECYKAGRIPAARCNISNPASKGSLLKAGMRVAGYMLKGEIKS